MRTELPPPALDLVLLLLGCVSLFFWDGDGVVKVSKKSFLKPSPTT